MGPERQGPGPVAAAGRGVDREPALGVRLDLRQFLDVGIEVHERREPDGRPLDGFPFRIDDRARHRGRCGEGAAASASQAQSVRDDTGDLLRTAGNDRMGDTERGRPALMLSRSIAARKSALSDRAAMPPASRRRTRWSRRARLTADDAESPR